MLGLHLRQQCGWHLATLCVCVLTGYVLYQSLLYLVILQICSKEFGDLITARNHLL